MICKSEIDAPEFDFDPFTVTQISDFDANIKSSVLKSQIKQKLLNSTIIQGTEMKKEKH